MSIHLHLPCLCTQPHGRFGVPPSDPANSLPDLCTMKRKYHLFLLSPIFLILLAPLFFFSSLSIISSILSILVKNFMLLVRPYVVLLAVIRGSRHVALFLAASDFLNARKLAYRVRVLS